MKRRRRLHVPTPLAVSRALNTLLDGAYFPATLQSGVLYQRVHDDCDGDTLQTLGVAIAPDSDVHVVLPISRDVDSLRFRTYFGGGMSLRVRNALLVLAEAIRRDNEERPQALRPPVL